MTIPVDDLPVWELHRSAQLTLEVAPGPLPDTVSVALAGPLELLTPTLYTIAKAVGKTEEYRRISKEFILN